MAAVQYGFILRESTCPSKQPRKIRKCSWTWTKIDTCGGASSCAKETTWNKNLGTAGELTEWKSSLFVCLIDCLVYLLIYAFSKCFVGTVLSTCPQVQQLFQQVDITNFHESPRRSMFGPCKSCSRNAPHRWPPAKASSPGQVENGINTGITVICRSFISLSTRTMDVTSHVFHGK